MTAKPLTDAERAAIVADLRAGEMSQLAIARRHGRDKGTVSRIAKVEGLRGRNIEVAERAREAREALYQRRRTDLKFELARVAAGLVRKMTAPTLVFSFNKDGVYSEHLLDQPTSGDLRNLAVSLKITIESMALIDQAQTSTGSALDDVWQRLVEDEAAAAQSQHLLSGQGAQGAGGQVEIGAISDPKNPQLSAIEGRL